MVTFAVSASGRACWPASGKTVAAAKTAAPRKRVRTFLVNVKDSPEDREILLHALRGRRRGAAISAIPYAANVTNSVTGRPDGRSDETSLRPRPTSNG